MSRPCKNCQTLAELNSNQAKTIATLEAKVEELERVNENHCKAHLMSIDKIDELTAARDAFEKMYLTAAYGSAAANNDAYSRGWVDALAGEYQEAGWRESDE